ncbi:Synaptotagmin-12 [Galemys pyrenaicus]|uniref:Synaptotagmin-12 n=1 Tax=Galemys pyrenaicus TaxID=202257 RepID=A0A8J6AUV9_GALPY|nr:Synaptotagmin-12 [Galemys pyrenaicus]
MGASPDCGAARRPPGPADPRPAPPPGPGRPRACGWRCRQRPGWAAECALREAGQKPELRREPEPQPQPQPQPERPLGGARQMGSGHRRGNSWLGCTESQTFTESQHLTAPPAVTGIMAVDVAEYHLSGECSSRHATSGALPPGLGGGVDGTPEPQYWAALPVEATPPNSPEGKRPEALGPQLPKDESGGGSPLAGPFPEPASGQVDDTLARCELRALGPGPQPCPPFLPRAPAPVCTSSALPPVHGQAAASVQILALLGLPTGPCHLGLSPAPHAPFTFWRQESGGEAPTNAGCPCFAVIKSPPGWEVGVYAAGTLALLGLAAVSLWKLWTSGSFPSPSPFPNYDYRYLQQKYGDSYAEARQKRVAAWNAPPAGSRGPSSRKGSLSLEDTFESVSELGPLELMGRELDLAPYGTLRKSQSADSLNSISSVSNTFGQDFTLGQVEVSMDYDGASHTLHVALLQGKDLLEREEGSFESCFMRVSLLPEEQIVGISRVQRNAYSILFDEKFSVPLDPAALEEKSLRLSVFGIDEDERNVSTGAVELKLSVLDLPLQPFSGWLYLQDQNKAADAVGEILLSLSYLPTAERLTVVVVKAKNLIWTEDKTTADPFVKVYLLQDGRKMSKKKTAVKRDDPNPVFNEAMIFSVPALALQDLSLRVTVAESSSNGRGDNVGHVIIGPSASGMGTTHWNQMLATLRRPVSMWHTLRRD